jgi:plastocyanin
VWITRIHDQKQEMTMSDRVRNHVKGLVAPLLFLGFALPGLVGPAGAEECAKVHEVQMTFIDATGFKPQTVTIQVGDCVRWLNVTGIEHSVVAVDRSFHTGILMPGTTGIVIEFKKPGVYPYICGPHPPMVGKVIVEP